MFRNVHLRLVLVCALAWTFSAARARADGITFSAGTASWQDGSAFSGSSYGTPFWNGNSSDGYQKNVGYLLTATGAFAGGTQYIAPGSLHYLGNSNGSSAPVETFTSQGSVDTTYIASIAGYAASNKVGIIDETTGVKQQISGSGTTLIAINAADTYGFYLQGPGTGSGYFFSDTSYSNNASTDGSSQHFAILSNNANGTGPFFVGVEDLPYTSSDLDYNDFVFEMQAVPAPAGVIVFAVGVAGLGAAGWRSRRNLLVAA